jgi:hypothetical protein
MEPLFEMEEQLWLGQGKGVAAFFILRLVFGNLYLAVAPYLNKSMKVGISTLLRSIRNKNIAKAMV